MKKLLVAVSILLAACGGPDIVTPETYLAEAEAYAQRVDEKVNSTLAYRSLPEYNTGDKSWSAMVGYRDNKPAVIKMIGINGNNAKWWIYPDSLSGKAYYFKEETRLNDKLVRNRIAYRGDSVALALASNDPYESPTGAADFRLKPAEVETLIDAVIKAVEADVKELTAEANAARRENAQFYATGGKNAWNLVINPSKSEVILRVPGKDEKRFGYDVPKTGTSNESIYTFNSLNGSIEVAIFSKPCNSNDGRKYPYTVTVKDKDKEYSGCGVLLQ
jgi:uncharacterized membrane protein